MIGYASMAIFLKAMLYRHASKWREDLREQFFTILKGLVTEQDTTLSEQNVSTYIFQEQNILIEFLV